MKSTEIKPVTTLRGIASIGVLILHVVASPLGMDATHILARGYIGVDLFFIISGFILMHVYYHDFEEEINIRKYLHFIYARLSRIYPIHLFVIIICLPAFGDGVAFSFKSLAFNILLLQGPELPYGSWYGYSWSVSAEWHAYLLFPMLARAAVRCNYRQSIVLMIVSFAIFAISTIDDRGAILATHGIRSFIRVISESLVGIFTYKIFSFQKMKTILNEKFTILFVLLFLGVTLYPNIPDIFLVSTFPFVILWALYSKGIIKYVMENQILLYIGHISYSLYMAQIVSRIFQGTLLTTSLGKSIGTYCGITLCLIVTILTAIIFHRYVEVPARELLRSFFKHQPALS